MEIKGKYNTAKVFASVVDDETVKQIKELCNQKFTKGLSISIMADCHAGKGCVIGTTMNIKDCLVPNLVGVDIGCGMLCYNLGYDDVDLIKLDRFVRKKIPSGLGVQKVAIKTEVDLTKLYCYESLFNKSRIERSLGSLGGGNHFIEIDKSDDGKKYLVIHTGSRNLGKQVCEYYQDLALKEFDDKYKKNQNALIKRYLKNNKKELLEEALEKQKAKYQLQNRELIPLYKESFNHYLADMKIAQEFANENRRTLLKLILNFLNKEYNKDFEFQTIHNYIDIDSMILRKGAIEAINGVKVLIPINMRDGSIIAVGKSNKDYNYSAPHGAGRLLSRIEAREKINFDSFKEAMEGIYSTSVCEDTIDESPFAYKSIGDILPNITDTVDVIDIIKPIYNFKACERRR